MVLGIGKKQDQTQKAVNVNPLDMLFAKGGSNSKQVTNDVNFLENWLSKRHIPTKTNLTQDQVNGVTILASLAAQYKIKPLKNLLMNFLMYMISKDAQSANQLVSIFQAKGLFSEQEMDMISKFAK